ncbi:MAG TPA: cyclic nucleotide-binding domain-containing protein [Candidatus Hydrogenedentes bacterium]|nr:cyclic nucleotide-binding domain-containing protein [Candidatus Hydrogenedentota bacterium]
MWFDSTGTTVLILNSSYILVAVALILRDIFWLRTAWTGGQVCMIAYGFLSNQPVILAWNCFFFSINAFQVVRLILERQDVHLPEELEGLRGKVFPLMSKRELLKFWNTGQVRQVTDECIVRRGEPQKHVYLIISGKVSVKKGPREVVRLGKHCFLAEMSFLSEMAATADVTAVGTVKYNAWEQTQLRQFRETDPELFIKIQSAVSRDLMRKLQHEHMEQTLL